MPRIDPTEVRRIAKLAKLEMTPADIENAVRYLGEILDYVETLQQVPTQGIDPYDYDIVESAGLRADRTEAFRNPDLLVAGDQFDEDDFMVTKGVFK